MTSDIKAILNDLETRNSNEPEFLQAVSEVLTSLEPVIDRFPKYSEGEGSRAAWSSPSG